MRQQSLRPGDMREVARANGERGFSTLELTLAMPLVVFSMLLLIGMGHALISKQHAVVGGQFAAHYQRVREAAPDAAAISRAVSGGGETIELSGGGAETLNFTVSATPRKGLIAQAYPLKATASQYQTPNVTNACVPRSKFPFIQLPRCKPPFEAFSKILNRRLVTNIITNGLRTALSPENILSTITGIGNKKRRQNPDGAVAIDSGRNRSGNDGSENGSPQTSAGGGGGGNEPPKRPSTGTGGDSDDGRPGGNGNNGNAGKGNPSSTPDPNATPLPAKPRPTPRPSPTPGPTPRPSPTPRPTPRPRTPREEASQRGAELVRQYKAEGVGQQAGRSGGHGDVYKRAGAKLNEEANKFPKNDPRRDAYKIEAERLRNRGRGDSHRGGGRGSR